MLIKRKETTMKLSKIIAAIAACAILAITMTACGDKSKTTEISAPETKATTTSAVVNTTEPIIETTEPVTETTTEPEYETVSFSSIEDEIFDKLDNMTSYTVTCNFEGNIPNTLDKGYDKIKETYNNLDKADMISVKTSYVYEVTENAAHLTSEFEEVGSGNKIFYEDYKTMRIEPLTYLDAFNEETTITEDYVLTTIINNNDSWTVEKAPGFRFPVNPRDKQSSRITGDYRRGTTNVTQYVNFEIGALAAVADYCQYHPYLGDAQRNEDGDYIFTIPCGSNNNVITYGCIQTNAIPNVLYDFHDWSDDDTMTYTFDKDCNIKSVEFDMNAKSSDISGHCVMNFEVNNNPVINVPSM